ncbi:hypothetical protein GCM10010376_16130 [Streptomyces violaceusniger]
MSQDSVVRGQKTPLTRTCTACECRWRDRRTGRPEGDGLPDESVLSVESVLPAKTAPTSESALPAVTALSLPLNTHPGDSEP